MTEMKTCFFKLLTCDNVIGEDEQFGCQEVLERQKRYLWEDHPRLPGTLHTTLLMKTLWIHSTFS